VDFGEAPGIVSFTQVATPAQWCDRAVS
jgi:hypothetical protein